MRQVSDRLWIAPQLGPDDMRNAASRGIAGIVNNRPNDEEPGQPRAAQAEAAARANGLAYVHIPVVPGQISLDQVRRFQDALADAEGPVLAHCKTGTRSATLYAIGEVIDGRMARDEVMPLGERVGLDLSGAIKWLDANGY